MIEDTVLLVGLGNPGSEYENNRHNIGFKILEAIVDASASSAFKKMATLVEVSAFFVKERKIILAKPQTFMNLSGRAVKFLMDFYKIYISNIYVFHDDIDLEFGRIKIKKGGSSGGHNGLKSIDNLIGSDYWRIRIGVSRPHEKSMVSSYVLHDFNSKELDVMKNICSEIGKNIELLFEDNKKFESNLNQILKNE